METLPKGFTFKDTPGHGYLMVRSDLVKQIPEYMRSTPYSPPGCYEEDCDWCLPVIVHRHLFDAKTVDQAMSTFKNYHPEKYERYFNTKLVKGESSVRDQEIFYQENTGNWITICAFGDWKETVKPGYCGVIVQQCTGTNPRGTNNPTKSILVPEQEYTQQFTCSDPEQYETWID